MRDQKTLAPAQANEALKLAMMWLAREVEVEPRGLHCLLAFTTAPVSLAAVLRSTAEEKGVLSTGLATVVNVLAPRMPTEDGVSVFTDDIVFPSEAAQVDRLSPLVPLEWLKHLPPGHLSRFPLATVRLAAAALSETMPDPPTPAPRIRF